MTEVEAKTHALIRQARRYTRKYPPQDAEAVLAHWDRLNAAARELYDLIGPYKAD